MNENTRVVVFCYQGDADLVRRHMPLHEAHQCPITVMSPTDSSYLNLVESLYAMGFLRETKLVFHFYSKARIHGCGAPVLLAPWTFLS